MPNQYTGGYGGGRFGGSGVAAYQGPTNIQSQSFFNPIPIDTMTGELDRRQNAFDVGYAGALAQKDALTQQQVGLDDLESKNRIIKEGMQGIDTLVQDQYGGDWGRAAKAVAGQVTAIRGHKFWNAQKEVEKRRVEARDFKIKNPNAFIFNDPSNLSTLDEQGNVRSTESFNVDMAARGDYAKTATDIMKMVESDAQAFGLQPVDVEGLSHFLQTGDRSGISDEKIRKLAANPAIQQLFLGQHGELGRIDELSPEQRKQQGLEGKTAEQFAEEQLLGAGLTRVHSKTDLKYIQDQMAIKRQTAAASAAKLQNTQIFSKDLTNVAEGQDLNLPSHRRQNRQFNYFESKVDGRGTGNMLTPEQWASNEEVMRRKDDQTGRYSGIANQNRIERVENAYDSMYDTMQNLRKSNPGYDGFTDKELMEAYYKDMDKFKLTFDKLKPIIHQDVTDGLTQHLSNHLQSGIEYMVEGRTDGVVDLTGKRGVSAKFNMSPQGIREYLKDEDIEYGYNYDKGMFYVEVPTYKNMQQVYDPEQTAEGFKKLYFAPDDDTKLLSSGIRDLEESLVKGDDYNKRVPMGESVNGNELMMEMSYGGTGGRPLGEDPMTDSNIEITVYEIDAAGNQTVAMMPDGVTPRTSRKTLDQVKGMISDFQEQTLRSYVKTED